MENTYYCNDGNNALSPAGSLQQIINHVQKLDPARQKYFWLQELNRRKKEEQLRYFSPLPYQVDTLKVQVAEKFILGGNRSGKTEYGAIETTIFALGKEKIKMYNPALYELIKHRDIPTGPKTIWVCSEDKNILKTVMLKKLEMWIPRCEIKRPYHQRDSNIILMDDTTIVLKSYDSEREKFQADDVHYIWLDEEPPEDIYIECQMRLLDYNGISLTTMTPVNGITWIYEKKYELRESNEDIEFFQFFTEENTYIPRNKIESMKRQYADDPDMLAVRLRGEFLQMTGIIYRGFRKHIHIIDELDPLKINRENTFYMSIDPGISHPTGIVFGMAEEDDTLIIFNELYENGLEVSEHAVNIKKILSLYRVQPYWTTIDPSAKTRNPETLNSVLDNYNSNGIYPIVANNDFHAGIIKVSEYLKLRPNIKTPEFPDGKPKLLICRNCVNLIKEIRNYRWATYKISYDKKVRKDAPVKIKDDLLDALRYMIMQNPIYIRKELIRHYKPNSKKTGY